MNTNNDLSAHTYPLIPNDLRCCPLIPNLIPNLVVKHIVDNFNMFGFGSEASALLQCVKELVENSLDASRTTGQGTVGGRVRVRIALSTADLQLLTIDVEDEGSGMRDPQDMLRCFTTDKTRNGMAGTGSGTGGEHIVPMTMTGRFGVGLSTCFLYSLVRTRVPMRVMTKHREAELAVIADFELDAELHPTAVQSWRVTVDMTSGTSIRIHLPIHPRTKVQTFHQGNLSWSVRTAYQWLPIYHCT